jgi:hypothetical protein
VEGLAVVAQAAASEGTAAPQGCGALGAQVGWSTTAQHTVTNCCFQLGVVGCDRWLSITIDDYLLLSIAFDWYWLMLMLILLYLLLIVMD